MRYSAAVVPLVLLASVGAAGEAPQERGRWTALPAIPTPRHDLAMVEAGGTIYAISGAGDLTTDAVEVFDPAAGRWTRAAPIPDERGWFGAVRLGGKIYCFGGKRVRAPAEKAASGDDKQYEYRNTVAVYDAARNRWSAGAAMRDADAGVKAAALGGKVYLLGGNHFPARVETYDPKADTWSPAPPLPEGRTAPGCEAVGGTLYVIGGWKGTEKADVFIFDPAAGRWSRGAAMPTPRRDFATAVVGERIWCIGGVNKDAGYLRAVEIYDTKANRWTAASPIPSGKAWAGACAVDGRVYLGGGARKGAKGKAYAWLDEMHVFLPDPTAGAPDDEIALTWWGCMSFEVNIGRLSLVFDPYVRPDTPRFDYIFCSHDHYDHCHEATLRKVIGPTGSRLKMLFASRGCFHASRLEGPTNFSDRPLTDLAYVPRGKAIALYPKYRDSVSPHTRPEAKKATFDGPTEVALGRLRVEGLRSHEDPRPFAKERKRDPSLAGPWPNLGYLVTDTQTGFRVAHLGDIWNAYPEMRRLRGKVDVLIYPLGKLNIREKIKMMDLIRPAIAIPTHYRLFEKDFPIPANFDRTIDEGQLGRDPALLKKACQGHWYPSPKDPVAEIKTQREKLRPFTRVVELKAGRRYVLPAELGTFKGRQR